MLSNTEQVFIILCLSPWQFYHPPKSRQQFAANIKRAAAAFLEIPDFWTVRINLSQFAKPVVVFGGLAPSIPPTLLMMTGHEKSRRATIPKLDRQGQTFGQNLTGIPYTSGQVWKVKIL